MLLWGIFGLFLRRLLTLTGQMPFLVAIVAMRRGLGMISKIEVSQLNGLLIPEYCLLLIGVISLIGDGVSEIDVIVSNRFELIYTGEVGDVSLIR